MKKASIAVSAVLMIVTCLVMAFAVGCGSGEETTTTSAQTQTTATETETTAEQTETTAEQTETTAAPGETKTLKIGVSFPLTGPMSMVGTIWVNGFEFVFDAINEEGGVKVGSDTYMIEMITEDSAADPATATEAAMKLVGEDKVDILIGDQFDFTHQSFYEVSSKAGILLVFPYGEISAALPGSPDVTSQMSPVIRLYPTDDETMINPVEYLVENYANAKNVSLLDIDFPGWDVTEPILRAALEERGLVEAGTLTKFPLDTVDFYPIVTKVLENKPDALYALHGTIDQFCLIVKTARDLGFTGPILHSTPYDQGLVAKGAPGVSDVFGNGVGLGETGLPSNIQELLENGTAKYGDSFSAEALQGYDVGSLLVQLVEAAQSLDGQKLQDTFESLTTDGSLESIFGAARSGGLKTCGANRIIVRPVPLSRMVGGTPEFVGYYTVDVP
jgi:branched-chain amino acid transport system substrate-binding protein